MTMKTRSIALTVALFALAPSAAWATTAIDYNIVVSGNFTATNSDVEGRVAAGGNISVGGYSIGANATGSGYVAVAGGTFNGTSGGSASGSTLASSYAGTAAPGQTQYSISGSKDTYAGGASSPIAIASEMARLSALSADLYNNSASYGTLGAYSLQNSNVTFTGSSSGVNIFNISDVVLATASSFTFAVPTGGTAIINVIGNSSTSSGSATISNTGTSGLSEANILYNFYDATSVNLTTVYGSVLAANADISTSYGVINGQVFAKSFSGSTQINAVDPNNGSSTYFSNTGLLSRAVGSAVPEPATWGLMLIGFGAIGLAIRRARRSGKVAHA